MNVPDNVIGLKDAAAMLGCGKGRLSKLAKCDEVPGAVLVLGRWGFDPALLADYKVPESQGGFQAREDGRAVCRIYLTPDECEDLRDDGFELVTAAELKARRGARRAAKAEAEAEAATE